MSEAVNIRPSVHVRPWSRAGTRTPIRGIVFVCLWGLTLLTFHMPEGGPSTALGSFAMLKVAVRIFSVGCLGMLLLLNWSHPKRSTVMRRFFFLSLFVGWGIVSVAWSALPKDSLGQVSGLVVLLLLAINFAVLMEGKRDLSIILFHLSGALLTFSTGLLLAHRLYPDVVRFSRFASTAVHPTNASSAASLGILVLVGAYLLWNPRWSRLMLVPGLLIHGYTLFLAQSRTATFLTLALVFAMYFGLKIRRMLPLVVLAASVATIAYLAADPGMKNARSFLSLGSQYVERGSPDDLQNFSGRTQMWNIMWNSYLDSPLIGHGYFVTSRTGSVTVWYESGNWTAHNLWLQALVTTGVVGALLLLWGLVAPLLAIRSSAATGAECQKVAHFVRVFVVWYFVWGLLDSAFLGSLESVSVVVFVVLGIGVGYAESSRLRGMTTS